MKPLHTTVLILGLVAVTVAAPAAARIEHPVHYTDNGDGTVTDELTGLTWQQGENGGVGYTISEASGVPDPVLNPEGRDVCGDLVLGGASDRRVPTARELLSIVDLRMADVDPAARLDRPARGFDVRDMGRHRRPQ